MASVRHVGCLDLDSFLVYSYLVNILSFLPGWRCCLELGGVGVLRCLRIYFGVFSFIDIWTLKHAAQVLLTSVLVHEVAVLRPYPMFLSLPVGHRSGILISVA